MFFARLRGLKEILEGKSHEVLLPSMKDYHHLEETALAKIQKNLIREHFSKIEQSDVLLVANYDKNGIKGYIGGNSFLEMGFAFHKKIPIFLLNEVPQKMSYKEELLALQPIVIGEDWDKLTITEHKAGSTKS